MKKRSIFNHRSLIKASLFVLVLMIVGQLNAINYYHNTPITSSETWARWDYVENEAITHVVQSGCYVAAGATLTLQDSCVVNIANPNGLNIYGGINANGSSNEIYFSGEFIKLSNATGN